MSYLIQHLHSGWAVDQAILAEKERLVIIRFGKDADKTCMQMDEVLFKVATRLEKFAKIYLVDNSKEQMTDFNIMYELYHPVYCNVLFQKQTYDDWILVPVTTIRSTGL